MFEDLYFEYPVLLNLLWVLALQVILLVVYWNWRERTLRRMGSRDLESRLLLGFSSRRFWLKNILFALGISLISVAIAGPVRLVKERGKTQKSADILIALDVSKSMLSEDSKPSRLELAKSFIPKILRTLDGERFALLFFAGDAYPQMPLSTDYESLLTFVRNADPDFINNQGTDIGAAIETGNRMLETKQRGGKAIILISDGENHQAKALQRVKEARANGVQIYTIGIGTTVGSTIPAFRGRKHLDMNGRPVNTRLDESFLMQLAKAGGGQYLNLKNESNVLKTLQEAAKKLEKKTIEVQASTKKEYYFPWLLIMAIWFLIAEQMIRWKKKIA